MKRKPAKQAASPLRHFRRHWLGLLASGLLIAAGFGARQVWRVTAPPPPAVNTAGFDPVIAAAIAKARDAIRRSPRSAEARGRMGMVLLAHEVRAEARVCFAQASAFAPGKPRWTYFLGLTQLVDDPMGAATNFDRAVRLFPESEFVPRLRLADTLLSLGRLEEAEAHYRHVWQRQPTSGWAALGLGKLANARDRSGEATNFLSAATNDPSTRRAAYRLLLNVHQRLGRANEAGQLARTLAELPNDKPFPDTMLAEVQALKTGEAAWIELSDEWIKTGRAAEAAQLLEKTLQTFPISDRAMFFLGRARLRLGDAEGADAILMRAIALAPGSVEAQMQLGVTRLSRGRAKEAQPCFRAAIQAKPNLAEGWFNLALSHGGEIGSRSEAMAAFREAIRLKPSFVEAYLGLAVVLRAEGQNNAAANELRRALSLQPEAPLRGKLLDQLKLAERR
ncbi:MAG: tetratricopeptide repeat protein [Verrucomicrobia bacterium]|nr:tetratricopeptide repeat protein [Verrucomicrobiota bacterium]